MLLKNIFLCFLFCVFCVCSANSDKQSKYCQVCDASLPCINGCGRAKACGQTKYGYEHLTTQEREFILNTSNTLRNKVATGANKMGFKSSSNMHVLSYDKESEFLAGCYLKQCKNRYEFIKVTLNGDPTCSNGFGIMSFNETRNRITTDEIEKAFDGWFHQPLGITKTLPRNKEPYLHGIMTQDQAGTSMDFVKLIWSDTKFIGCAKFYFRTYFHFFYYTFFCVFRPSGGWERPMIYDVGTPASKCAEFYGEEPNSLYEGLCGNIRPMEDDDFEPEVDLSRGIIFSNGVCIKFAILLILLSNLCFV